MGLCLLFTPVVYADNNSVQIKVVVVDVNQKPVIHAKVYRKADYIYDNVANQLLPSINNKVLTQTDANGVFFLDVPKRFKGENVFFITDNFLQTMGCLKFFLKESKDIYTVTLTEPAHIKTAIESGIAPFSALTIKIDLREPQRRVYWNCMTINYEFSEETNSVPIDILCPSGCYLSLEIELMQPGTKVINIDVLPLTPRQIFELDTIVFKPISGGSMIGKRAPELQVADWIKGKPIAFEQLKGKVVLLDFWGIWCGPCKRIMPELIKLHEKYYRDGLVIIGIHDCSENSKGLAAKYNLSDIPFLMAIDSRPAELSGIKKGPGRTINAYNVTAFPTLILVSQNGTVEGYGLNDLEKRINLLLYGNTKNLNSELSLFQSLLKEGRKEFVWITVSFVGISAVVGFYIWRKKTIKRKR